MFDFIPLLSIEKRLRKEIKKAAKKGHLCKLFKYNSDINVFEENYAIIKPSLYYREGWIKTPDRKIIVYKFKNITATGECVKICHPGGSIYQLYPGKQGRKNIFIERRTNVDADFCNYDIIPFKAGINQIIDEFNLKYAYAKRIVG
jgi:hypothetical protein